MQRIKKLCSYIRELYSLVYVSQQMTGLVNILVTVNKYL
jgi:hypothetical protein